MNLLWICTDEHRADHLGCYGNPVVRSPNLDAFASRALRFDHSYVANPVCSPNRSCFFTGLYSTSHGVVENGHFLDEGRLTLPEVLRGAGYQTHASGKLHLAPYYIEDGAPAPARAFFESRQRWAVEHAMPRGAFGFDEHYYVGSHTSVVFGQFKREMEQAHPGVVEAFQRERAVRDDGAWLTWTADVPEHLHYNTRIADETIAFLGKQAAAKLPFFAWCSFPDPHGPFVALPRYVEPYLKAEPGVAAAPEPTDANGWPQDLWARLQRHRAADLERHFATITSHIYAMIEHVDAQIGRVLSALHRLGLEDDTVVVFSSDHGHWHGDHGLLGKGWLLTRGLVRTPLLMSVPGAKSKAQSTNALVSSVDMMPTLLELLRLPLPDGLDGKSFASLFDHPKPTHRDHVRIEWQETALNLQAVQLRCAQSAFTRYAPTGETLLFDLERDPHELHNLWPEQSGSEAARILEATLTNELMHSLKPKQKPWARC